MHQYLKAIGFGNVRSKKEMNKVLLQVKNLFTQQDLISQDEEIDLCEYRKEFGAGIGISLCGDMDIDENLLLPLFLRDRYYELCGRICGKKNGQGSLCGNL